MAVLTILAFVFAVGYIISSVDPKHSITGYSIAISFIGIFATFGGAYLGAKISGDNAVKLAKKESMINDLRNTIEYSNKVLDKFNDEGLKKNWYVVAKNKIRWFLDWNNYLNNFETYK